MSFRGRLALFFVLIVIVPMVSVTIVIFSLISNNEQGKSNAAIAARLETARNLAGEATREADRGARAAAADVPLATALRAHDNRKAQRRAIVLAPRLGLARLLIFGADRHAVADVGAKDAVFPSSRRLLADGTEIATLQASVQTGRQYATLVKDVTGLQVVLRRRGNVLATTLPASADSALAAGTGSVVVDGTHYRAASLPAEADFRGGLLQITLLRNGAQVTTSVHKSRLLVAGILLGFFLLAVACAVAVSRSLQAQVTSFLKAARQLGGGQFDARVPTVGNDEFAALGQEFNTLGAQLEQRLAELRDERTRVERSMRRLGEALASNLDRDALLGIVVETAVDGVGADGGRASARMSDGTLEERSSAGRTLGLQTVLSEAEAQASEIGQPSESTVGDSAALAHPLHTSEGGPDVLGVVSVGRSGRGFSQADRDLFSYLAAQAAVSLENVDLHETVQRQAVTDELTGLYNHRRFQQVLAGEVERARRFPEQGLGLVLLDIDDFKRVNDTYGHQMGDEVLREIARVLRESSREIDAPSRYGGEELAVVLPGTDLQGAYELAERVRAGIERLTLPIVAAGNGEVLHVTASFGAAASAGAETSASALIAAADTALYEAKRAGKNKTVRAE
jgi:diguanylate cyclase (GGDEF)-like protein